MSSFISSHLQPVACEIRECSSKDGLKPCEGCHSVSFCKLHREKSLAAGHKNVCKEVARLQNVLKSEELKLHEIPTDEPNTPYNVFEDEVGYFWNMIETRAYMRARYKLADTVLQRFGNAGGKTEAVSTALDHFLGMMILCRADNLGLRDIIPALYIRLGKDQEAYDFLKWYATMGVETGYDWSDMCLPFLNLAGEDLLESTWGLWSGNQRLSLSHYVAVTLLKIRALQHLQVLQRTTKKPQTSMSLAGSASTESSVPAAEKISELKGNNIQFSTSKIEEVERQIDGLYNSIRSHNSHLWMVLLRGLPESPQYRPPFHSPGSREEAYMVVGFNISAWIETPGAIEIMRAKHKHLGSE